MPPNGGAGNFSPLVEESEPEPVREPEPKANGKHEPLPEKARDELMLFGLYGHNGAAPPAASFVAELRDSGWVLRSNSVADALEAFATQGRAAGLSLPIPNSDGRRKDWAKSLADHVDDWGLESLTAGRYRAVFELAKEGGWLNRISRPGAVDKALAMVENEVGCTPAQNEDGSYYF